MTRERIAMTVMVDLDPVPGMFNTAESATAAVTAILLGSIPHYNPVVVAEEPEEEEEYDEGCGESKCLWCYGTREEYLQGFFGSAQPELPIEPEVVYIYSLDYWAQSLPMRVTYKDLVDPSLGDSFYQLTPEAVEALGEFYPAGSPEAAEAQLDFASNEALQRLREILSN